MTALLFLGVALGAGILGMMGLGGGVVYVPLLSWGGLDFKTGAIPLSLLLSSVTGLTAAYTYHADRRVHLRPALSAAVAAVVGAPFGALAGRFLAVNLMKVLFALAAGTIAIRILRSVEPKTLDRLHRTPIMATAAVGFFVGFSSGLLGIGGGFLLVPFLMSTGFPTKEAVATSSLVVTFSAMSGFLSHLPKASFPAPLALLLILGVAAGSRIGVTWASRHARPETLRRIVGTLIFIIAVKVAWEGCATWLGRG